MDKKLLEEKYGPQSPGDNTFTAKARLLQSVYRVQSGETSPGIGPDKNSVDKHQNPTYYGNMLFQGEISGKNFFFSETFEYALKRVRDKKPEETIGEYRLFNNLLSSMPMAFNLFHPLMMIKEKHPDLLNRMIRNIFPELPVSQVDEILIEFIPTPVESYTKDKSAMDAAILFSDKENNKYIVAIETKYTDSLGLNKAKDNEMKMDAALESDLFTVDGLRLINKGCTQIYRNFLLTEKYRMVHHLKDSFSVILAPEDHPSTNPEIVSLKNYLKPENHYKLKKYSLEDFLSNLNKSCPDTFQPWLKWFFDRYLDFDKIEPILNEPTRS
jgi:hypothetical protein